MFHPCVIMVYKSLLHFSTAFSAWFDIGWKFRQFSFVLLDSEMATTFRGLRAEKNADNKKLKQKRKIFFAEKLEKIFFDKQYCNIKEIHEYYNLWVTNRIGIMHTKLTL